MPPPPAPLPPQGMLFLNDKATVEIVLNNIYSCEPGPHSFPMYAVLKPAVYNGQNSILITFIDVRYSPYGTRPHSQPGGTPLSLNTKTVF